MFFPFISILFSLNHPSHLRVKEASTQCGSAIDRQAVSVSHLDLFGNIFIFSAVKLPSNDYEWRPVFLILVMEGCQPNLSTA